MLYEVDQQTLSEEMIGKIINKLLGEELCRDIAKLSDEEFEKVVELISELTNHRNGKNNSIISSGRMSLHHS